MINPAKHPKRHAAQQERRLAERARALAVCLPLSRLAEELGISRERTETLCARNSIPFFTAREDKL